MTVPPSVIPEKYGQYYLPPSAGPTLSPEKPGRHADIENAMSFPSGLDEFIIEKVVGYGNYCEVVIAQHRDTKKDYAIKMIDKRKCEQTKHTMDVLMEKHVLSRLKNELYDPSDERDFPFPIIHACLRDELKLYIIQEALNGGELWESIKEYGCLWEPRAKALMAQISLALRKLHGLKIVHRDLKLENVMLRNSSQHQGEENSAILIDFGTCLDLSRPDLEGGGNTTRGRKGKKWHHWVGTPHFMPPEAVHNRHSDLRNDLWSLGCLLYQLHCGHPPFEAPSDFLIFIKSGYKMLYFPPDFPADAKDLCEKLIQFQPKDRLGAGNEPLGKADTINWDVILEHPYFNGIDTTCPVSLIHLDPQPIHQTLLHKASQKMEKWLIREPSNDHPWLTDVSIEPSSQDIDTLITDDRLIELYNDICLDERYKTECVQCQSSNKRRALPPKATTIGTCLSLIAHLSCTQCQPITYNAARNDLRSVWQFIRRCIHRRLHHRHRLWRDKERDDGYWVKLSDEYMNREPLDDKGKGDVESDVEDKYLAENSKKEALVDVVKDTDQETGEPE